MVKKSSFWIFKILFLSLAFYFLYQKLESIEISNLNWRGHSNSWISIFGFLAAWAANLLLDAKAWQRVQSILHRISLKTALIHNLKCYGLAFISPLNSGELAGRYIIQENPYDRKKALFLTFWTHAPKLFSKALLSFLILAIMLPLNGSSLGYSLVLVLLFTLSLFIYLRLERLLSYFNEKQIWKRPVKDYMVKGKPEVPDKLVVLSLNGLRFLLFSSQLALVILSFKPDVISWELYWSIPLYYFISAFIPSYTGFDFIIKGTLALYFFELFEADALTFTLAGTVVWFFNWAMPAITGLSVLKKIEMDRFTKRLS